MTHRDQFSGNSTEITISNVIKIQYFNLHECSILYTDDPEPFSFVGCIKDSG